jgi:molybdopterin biosynthesis enzyme MoaB
MRSFGAQSTINSYLSRSLVGVRGSCLIVNMPGSTGGAKDSLTALEPVLDHALTSLTGPFDHDRPSASNPRAKS